MIIAPGTGESSLKYASLSGPDSTSALRRAQARARIAIAGGGLMLTSIEQVNAVQSGQRASLPGNPASRPRPARHAVGPFLTRRANGPLSH